MPNIVFHIKHGSHRFTIPGEDEKPRAYLAGCGTSGGPGGLKCPWGIKAPTRPENPG